MSEKWLGLSDEEWLSLWDGRGWRVQLKNACVEVASCLEADVEDRLTALQCLNDAMKSDVLFADPWMPQFILEVLLSVTRGERGSWWKRWYWRRVMHRRALGAMNLLRTGHQFIAGIRASAAVAVARPALPDKLLS